MIDKISSPHFQRFQDNCFPVKQSSVFFHRIQLLHSLIKISVSASPGIHIRIKIVNGTFSQQIPLCFLPSGSKPSRQFIRQFLVKGSGNGSICFPVQHRICLPDLFHDILIILCSRGAFLHLFQYQILGAGNHMAESSVNPVLHIPLNKKSGTYRKNPLQPGCMFLEPGILRHLSAGVHRIRRICRRHNLQKRRKTFGVRQRQERAS